MVNAERDSHPERHVRRKMLVVWLLHCGLTRAKAAQIAGLSRLTNLSDHIREQKHFLETQLQPRLDEAVAGRRQVFFVDAAHFVFGTFLCCLWSLTRRFVKAASGRQRFNVLGAWNAVTRELLAITNTLVVNTETMCDLLRAWRPGNWGSSCCSCRATRRT